MRLPRAFVAYLDKLAQDVPDEIIGHNARSRKATGHNVPVDRPLLRRWLVIPKNRWLNIYYHNFILNDEDRALHDHPWANLSIVVHGEYIEHTIAAGGVHKREIIREGQCRFRLPSRAHRVELVNGKPSWSFFITGPVVHTWGFHCPDGRITHSEFHKRGGCDAAD